MCLRWLLFALASVGCVSANANCSYEKLIEYLGLNDNNVKLTSLRPVDNWKNHVTVYIDLFVTSITEVNEKAQSISTQVLLAHGWGNDFTTWKPDDFCGMSACSVKKDMVWTPDIVIAESIKTEIATMENAFVRLESRGDQLQIRPFSDASFLTQSSQKAFQTQGEWELISINMSNNQINFIGDLRDQLIFRITIKRKPVLYVIDFIMPVFCFLILDLASFFVSSGVKEKLGFKVTLLLAISVLLLLLKDMLPSTASDVPLIGMYCVIIFTLIGISVLETIFLSFLMDRGKESASVAPMHRKSALSDAVKSTEGPADSVSDRNEAPLTADALRQIIMEFQVQNQQQKKKSLSWTRVAKIIDLVFFLMYATTVLLFLIVLSIAWFP
ncbi:5-hydroxytryptamine receptor 3A isoform X2 [Danio rerio]|uniref:5-hydroxytryptamine receptor 3A isoform X2 n=1 Tax=Danio rerio TaxID=7955 RepID=A0AC58J4G5_DANRE